MQTILPPNATALEIALELVEAERMEALRAEVTTLVRLLYKPDACPEAFLPFLAWFLGVTQWSNDWPIAIRRAKIKSAIAIHKHAGTVQAVADVVANYGGAMRLVEWWQMTPPGDPYTFAITITLGGQSAAPSADLLTAMTADIDRAKPARAHYAIDITTSATAQIGLRAAVRAAIYRRLD